MATHADVKSPLHETVTTTATDYWNDSCSIEELTYAIANGAVGATSNPTIVGEVLKKEMHLWRERIGELIAADGTATEDELTWLLIEEMAVKGAELLLPVFEREGGRKGRLSIQTNPKLYRNAARIAEQAIHFAALAPNMQVKAPVTRAGVDALERMTAAGVNVNATVCFTVPQALAVGEAVERGLRSREAAGQDVAGMAPVCTIMVGRLDDWLQVYADREGILLTPGYANWSGIACIKKAYDVAPVLYKSCATCHHAGGVAPFALMSYADTGKRAGLIATVTAKRYMPPWLPSEPRFEHEVPAEIVSELYEKLPEFRRAYDADGMTIDEFDGFGATVRTLRQFIASYQDLVAVMRDFMLPNPDNA